MQNIYVEAGDAGLDQLISSLNEECYNPIRKICADAQLQASRLQSLESKLPASQYTTICHSLITDINNMVSERVHKYIPYAQSLSEKASTNHNCSTCTGSCKLNHDLNLMELKNSHSAIRNILNRLQIVSLPLYTETAYSDSYRALRNQMALIENNLSKLYIMEELHLIPKVAEAQKSINAAK